MSYDNTNTGAIFKNKKEKDSQPDYKGTINVDGKEKEIALWVKTSKDGSKTFFSAKIQEPRQKDESTQKEEKSNDLPF